jgi:putative ABC transport system permease protein
VSDARVEAVASIAPAALPGATRNVVLIDVRDAAELGRGDFRPQHLLVALDGSVPSAAVATAIERIVGEARSDTTRGDVSVVSAEQIRESLRSSPVIGGLERIQGIAAGAALLLAIAALVLATASARRRRMHLLAVLGSIGADRRQQRRALAWQFAPGVIAALIVGILLGLALPYAVTAAVDLRPFVGGRVPPSPVIDVGILAIGIGGFAVVAGVASVLTGRRRAPAALLKMGER